MNKKKVKVAFYLDNESIKDIECSNILDGNPGMGGTQYLFLLLTYLLSVDYEDYIDITLLLKFKQCVPKNIKTFILKDENNIVRFYTENNVDILVIRPSNDLYFLDMLNENNITTVLWSHNFYTSYKLINKIIQHNNIVRNVFVGKEQMEYYIDSELYKKSIYIYNFIINNNTYISTDCKKSNVVTYIGNFSKGKGLHVVAKNWNKIKKDIPDAQLFIIGGNLYNEKNNQKKYQKKIMKYLTNKNGKMIDGVKFFGIMGSEKLEIIRETKVGLGTLGKKEETFGLTALEFQSQGVPVISRENCGYMDTIIDGVTGFTCKTEKSIVRKIKKMLTDTNLYSDFSNNAIEFINTKFNSNEICNEWIKLFYDIVNNLDIEKNNIYKNKRYKLKYIKILIYKMNKCFPKYEKLIPSISETEVFLKETIKKLLINIKGS